LHKSVIGGAAVLVLATGGVAAAQIVNSVSSAQPASGTPANLAAGGYRLQDVAVGADPLENPIGQHVKYGNLADGTRTEPDQNLYLVTTANPGGPTAGYDYGRHFLIQGHENGSNKAYFTRINLDVTDPAHHITLLTPETAAGNGTTGVTSVDGVTYDPFSGDLLFTQEASFNAAYSATDTAKASGGVAATKLDWGGGTTIPAVTRLDGLMGSGGFEGVQVDSLGNVYIVEDAGGSGVTDGATATKVKQPNSFVYRFKPANPANLAAGGKLQVLQVSDAGTPITFHTAADGATAVRDDALGAAIQHLHSGSSLTAKWVTIHDSAVDGTAAFNANQLAKQGGPSSNAALKGTPLKRPENGKFVPETDFKSFVFTETGDTDNAAGTYAGAADRAAWGALVRVDMPSAGSDDATVKTIALGDATHNSFDNITFLDKTTMLVGEDRGDTLHDQLNALDSVWSFDLTKDIASINADAKRLFAQGRDTVAADPAGEDNEPTGIFVSNGATSTADLLGANDPGTQEDVRIFVTNQHGLNITQELTAAPSGPTGPAGPAGPAGPQGPAGPAGSSSPSAGSGTVSWTFAGPSKRSRQARVRVDVPTSGHLTAKLTARRHGRTIPLGSTKRTVDEPSSVTLKVTIARSQWKRIVHGDLTQGSLTLTFAPAKGTAGSTTKKVSF